jgi:selenocysteine lyase/cysteine desulfurase
VLGIRSYAQKYGARVSALREEEVEQWLSSEGDEGDEGDGSSGALNLFAFPAKDNFAGVLYPLEWIDKVHDKGDDWLVLLDTAAYAPTYRIDLSAVKPDFLVVSFYKMFGLPSGVGCWIMKRSAEAKLRRTYWGDPPCSRPRRATTASRGKSGSRGLRNGRMERCRSWRSHRCRLGLTHVCDCPHIRSVPLSSTSGLPMLV